MFRGLFAAPTGRRQHRKRQTGKEEAAGAGPTNTDEEGGEGRGREGGGGVGGVRGHRRYRPAHRDEEVSWCY